MTKKPTKAQLELRDLELDVWKKETEQRLIEAQGIAKGEFYYTGVVEEEQVHNLIDRLETWSNAHPGAPITVVINSQGGVVIDGFALYDYLTRLKSRGHHLTTVGLGIAGSMGGVLLQAGDERVMTPRAWMLVHEVQGFARGSFSEMKNIMRFNERLQEQAMDILAERSTWTRAKLKKSWVDDLWLDASDALAAGFIDRIESEDS